MNTQTTLQEYFDRCYLPSALERRLSRDRIGEMLQAIHRYKWWCLTKDRIVHPVLVSVTPSQLSRFRRDCLDAEIPGRDGKKRVCTGRSINKSLQIIESVLAAAMEDGELDESRGLVRIRKCAYSASVRKFCASEDHLAAIFSAASTATWPQRDHEGRPVDAPLWWQVAIVLFVNFGMRTQDLLRYEKDKAPIRWGGVLPPGQSPFGIHDSKHGWLFWRPNKTRRTKENFSLCHPVNATVSHWLARLKASTRGTDRDPLLPIPLNKQSLHNQWMRILAESGARPKPVVSIDAAGNVVTVARDYMLWHLRGTAGTRVNDHGESLGHPGMGRLLLGHGSKEVFEQNYRSSERPIIETISTLPQPVGFSSALPVPAQSALRVVG